jgi:hypothetical protein
MQSGLMPPTHERAQRVALALVCAVLGLAAGALAVLVNPLFALPLIPLAAGAIWATRSPERALWLLVAGIAILPRVASPVSIGFKPTVIDVALLLLLAAWVIDRARRRVKPSGPAFPGLVGYPLAALIFVAVAAFIAGIPNGPLTTLVLRRFGELILTLLSVYVMTGVLAAPAARQLAVTAVILFGALAAFIGLVLYAIPDETAMRLLSALRPFGYPEGSGVLRYVLDDPAQLQRATGLWIDPNAFGGFLLVAGAVTLPQVFAPRPALPRALTLLCMAAIGLALVLTVSRGAMIALGLVALLMGVFKYRRILPLIGVVLVAAVALPQTRELIAHFADGFAARDLATQMRVGEYKDAFRLIERYPIFGVGFTDTPDVDLYIGVSNMYLLIAQQMGLVGLTVFVVMLLGFFAVGARAMRTALRNDTLAPVWLGAHGAVIGALMTGMVDHYFFNIDFHNSVMLFWIMVALALASSTTIADHDAAQSESPEEDRHRHGLRPNGQRDRA